MVDRVNRLPRTTGELLRWLQRLGLSATSTQLANDCRDGFLPPAPIDAIGEGRGRSTMWESWMVRRAERLYRLRKRKDASGRPLVYGDTLRLLLFIRDGWGWSGWIREICVKGFDKSVAATLAPVRRYVRGPLDRETAEDAVETHEIPLTPAERHSVGLLASGEPLEGASLEGVYRATDFAGLTTPLPDRFVRFLQPLGIHDGASFGATLFRGFSGDALRTMLSNLSDDDARRAVARLTDFYRPLRAFVHRASVAENKRNQSTNPFSMFGQTQREVEKSFREGGAPQRITPAQMLATFLGVQILGDTLFHYMDDLATLIVETTRKFGLKPPDDERNLLPFAVGLVQRAFSNQQIPFAHLFSRK
jgi:hypothetical protein